MIAVVAIALSSQAASGFVAGPYELGERMKRVEVAWMAVRDPARRRAASESLLKASAATEGKRPDEAALAIDEALAKLEGRRVRPSDALNIRPERPFSEPGATVSLKATWAYRPTSVVPVRIGVGNRFADVKPGSTTTLTVNPWVVNPELRLNQEVGYLMPVRVGSDTRYAFLSFVRRSAERVAKLAGSENRFVSDLGKLLQGYQNRPASLDAELPLVSYLFSAEAVEEGKAKVGELEQAFFARQGSTVLRAAFPKTKPEGPQNVVIVLGDAGSTENTFFDRNGRGAAVAEALRRGWGLIAARPSERSIDDAIEWLVRVRGVEVGRVFLIGQGQGARLALAGTAKATPAAVAAFSPAADRTVVGLEGVPVLVSVGRMDTRAEAALAHASGRKGWETRAYDFCEATMMGTEAMPEAFKFFDRFAGGPGSGAPTF